MVLILNVRLLVIPMQNWRYASHLCWSSLCHLFSFWVFFVSLMDFASDIVSFNFRQWKILIFIVRIVSISYTSASFVGNWDLLMNYRVLRYEFFENVWLSRVGFHNVTLVFLMKMGVHLVQWLWVVLLNLDIQLMVWQHNYALISDF